MKTYTNGQRKGMMYGGMSKRKPMMNGGMATKKPRKKAYGGGMMTNTMTQNQRQNNRMNMNPMMQGMAKGGFPDMTGDGKVTQADILKGRGVKFD